MGWVTYEFTWSFESSFRLAKSGSKDQVNKKSYTIPTSPICCQNGRLTIMRWQRPLTGCLSALSDCDVLLGLVGRVDCGEQWHTFEIVKVCNMLYSSASSQLMPILLDKYKYNQWKMNNKAISMSYLYGRWIGWGGLPVINVCFADLCHLPSEGLFFREGHLLIGSLRSSSKLASSTSVHQGGSPRSSSPLSPANC